jgi:hypothetical protein
MSEHIQKTIADLEEKLKQQLAEVSRSKRTINDLCEMAGLPARYADTEMKDATTVAAMRSDQFYGRPLATAVREYLEMRKASNLGPATVNAIYDALVEGGFKFETTIPENAKRNLRISLAKNTAVFHRLPNGDWGLLDWYPAAKVRTARGTKNGDDEPALEETAEEAEK